MKLGREALLLDPPHGDGSGVKSVNGGFEAFDHREIEADILADADTEDAGPFGDQFGYDPPATVFTSQVNILAAGAFGKPDIATGEFVEETAAAAQDIFDGVSRSIGMHDDLLAE